MIHGKQINVGAVKDNITVNKMLEQLNKEIGEINKSTYKLVGGHHDVVDSGSVIEMYDIENAISTILGCGCVESDRNTVIVSGKAGVDKWGKSAKKTMLTLKVKRKRMSVKYSRSFTVARPEDKMVIVAVVTENAEDGRIQVGEIRKEIKSYEAMMGDKTANLINEYVKFLRSKKLTKQDVEKIEKMVESIGWIGREEVLKRL